MNNIRDRLRDYLARKEDVDLPEGTLPYITLNRQDGVNVHEVGREIIRRLDALPDLKWNRGWELFDQNLCAELIKFGRIPATYEGLLHEHYGERGLHQMVYEMFVGKPEQLDIQKRVGEVMRFLMLAGKVVVVGCAAACEATALHPPRRGLRIRLTASEAYRVARLCVEQSVSHEAARRQIRESDAGRGRLVREYYRRDLDDPGLYDASFAMDDLAPGMIADGVAGMLTHRAGLPRKAGSA